MKEKNPIGISNGVNIELFVLKKNIVYFCSLCEKEYRLQPAHISSSWVICERCWKMLIKESKTELSKGCLKRRKTR